MSQTLKLTGLEEGGLLTSTLLDKYNSLKTNAAKRRLMLDVLRNGFALEQMGLGPVIALLERTDGENFLKMSEQDRLRRMMTLIGALLGETPAVQPPAQTQPASRPPEPVDEPLKAEPPAVIEDEAEVLPEDDDVVTVTRNEEDNSSRRVEAVKTATIPAAALKLRSSGSLKRSS